MTSRISSGQTVLQAWRPSFQARLPFFHVGAVYILPQAETPCFFISLAPVLVALGVLLLRAFLAIAYRPRWLRPFITERADDPKSFTGGKATKAPPTLPNALLALAVFGFITQVLPIWLDVQHLTALSRVLAWVRAVSTIFDLH